METASTSFADVREARPGTAIIVTTGKGDVPFAVEAMRAWSRSLSLEARNVGKLEIFLRKSLEVGGLRRGSREAQKPGSRRGAPDFGSAPPCARSSSSRRLAAENEAPVLLQGETGVGKGVLARWIHEHGEREAMPFVELVARGCAASSSRASCSAMRGGLHLGGGRPAGLLDIADGGTLFLDEIGELDAGCSRNFQGSRRSATEGSATFESGAAPSASSVRPQPRPGCRRGARPVPRGSALRRQRLSHSNPCAARARRRHARAGRPPAGRAGGRRGGGRRRRDELPAGLFLAGQHPRAEPRAGAGADAVRSRAPRAHALRMARARLEPARASDRADLEQVLREHGGNVEDAARALGLSRATLYRRLKDGAGSHRSPARKTFRRSKSASEAGATKRLPGHVLAEARCLLRQRSRLFPAEVAQCPQPTDPVGRPRSRTGGWSCPP